MNSDKNITIEINIKNHLIHVTNSTFVVIQHNKNCKDKCTETFFILDYLKSELFIDGDFVLAEQKQ